MYSDGEGGLNNPETKNELAHAGTKLINRPTGQHAHYIEARNGILRDTMHKLEAELERQGIPMNFPNLVGEANFAGNAFTFYNGVSPYNAVFGRQPQCLPDLENFDFPKEGTNNRG